MGIDDKINLSYMHKYDVDGAAQAPMTHCSTNRNNGNRLRSFEYFFFLLHRIAGSSVRPSTFDGVGDNGQRER